MKHWLISLSLAVAAIAAQAAVPSVTDVEAQVRQGHYAQAQTMMQEVVAAKPGSARAHYIYAEILAHNERFADAARETASAKRLDPSLAFTDPAKFKAFERLIDSEQARTAPASRSGSSLDKLGPALSSASPSLPARSIGTPSANPNADSSMTARAPGDTLPRWVWPVGIAALAFALWRMLSRRSATMSPPRSATMGAGVPAAGYGYGSPPAYPGYAPNAGGVAPSAGSGLLGTGLAAAGGVAAGMLAERLLERGSEHRASNNSWSDPGFNDPGSTPSVDEDARELEQRNVDFGSGGDNWDAGSVDTGSSGGSDDGGW